MSRVMIGRLSIRRLATGLAALILASGTAWSAEPPVPAFARPEVLKAALQIGLSETQQPQFREAVTRLFNCRIGALNKLMKARDQVDMERKLRSKTKGCVKAMDKETGAFLTAEQMAPYHNYREVLLANMEGM